MVNLMIGKSAMFSALALVKSKHRSKIILQKEISGLIPRFEKIKRRIHPTINCRPNTICWVSSFSFSLGLTLTRLNSYRLLLVTLQLLLSKNFLSNDPCKKYHWLSLFRKVHFLKFDTGALEKSGISKGAAIRKSLGTTALRDSICTEHW